jgi:hypothetical protein
MSERIIAMSEFEDHLSARARTARYLFRHGYIDQENARSQLQRFAEKSGAVSKLGQDRIQEIIAAAFGRRGVPALRFPAPARA